MDSIYGVGMPVEDFMEKGLGSSNPPDRFPTGRKDILTLLPGELVLVGSFESFDFVLTKSQATVYSELHFRVDRTIFPSAVVPEGTVLDLLEPGGTIFSRSGKTLPFKANPRAYGLTPFNRYIVFLRHVDSGDFYLLGDSILLKDGTAHPNSPDTIQAAKEGTWQFDRFTESGLVETLTRKLH